MAIQWRAFPLHPEIPEDGLLIEKLFARYPVNVKEIVRNLKKTADGLGLPFGEQKMVYNSRLAQEMGLWAESKAKGDAFHMAVFHAYFVEGENIAKIPVLLDIASSFGLPLKEAEEMLTARSFKAAVDDDWALSKKKMITAVPTFFYNQEKLVGAQPYEKLKNFIEKNGDLQKTKPGD